MLPVLPIYYTVRAMDMGVKATIFSKCLAVSKL